MCKAPLPERRNTQFRQDYRKNIQQQSTPQTRRFRHVKEQDKCVEEEETEEETVDAEAALYIKELMEDWSSVNKIRACKSKTNHLVHLWSMQKQNKSQTKTKQAE